MGRRIGLMETEADNLKNNIDQVTGLIYNLSNSTRQLSLCALDLQSLCLSKKHQIEKAIDNVYDLESVIGRLIELLEKLICCYIIRRDRFDECQLQNQLIDQLLESVCKEKSGPVAEICKEKSDPVAEK
jgi:hypothetical protein